MQIRIEDLEMAISIRESQGEEYSDLTDCLLARALKREGQEPAQVLVSDFQTTKEVWKRVIPNPRNLVIAFLKEDYDFLRETLKTPFEFEVIEVSY